MFDLMFKALPPETKAVLEQMPAALARWDAMITETHAATARIELALAGSAVTPEIHGEVAAMASADPRNTLPLIVTLGS